MSQCKLCNKEIEDNTEYCPDCIDLQNKHEGKGTQSSPPDNNNNNDGNYTKNKKQKSSAPIVSASVSILVIASMLAVLLVNGAFGGRKLEAKNVSAVPFLSTLNSDYHIEMGADGNYYVIDKEGNSVLFDPSESYNNSVNSSSQWSQIVVGPDGQAYLLDAEGNAVLYNPTTHAVIDPNATIPTYSPNTQLVMPTYDPQTYTMPTFSSPSTRPSTTTTTTTSALLTIPTTSATESSTDGYH